MFDVLRSDRCISRHGLEPRTPFLDRTFVNYYLSLPINLRNPHTSDICDTICEKQLLQQFQRCIRLYFQMIFSGEPKEAFSDGVSGEGGSWFEIIKEKVAEMKLEVDPKWTHNIPTTKEQIYYRKIYEEKYPHTEKCIPYFWMPKYVEADDCSARTLDIYKRTIANS